MLSSITGIPLAEFNDEHGKELERGEWTSNYSIEKLIREVEKYTKLNLDQYALDALSGKYQISNLRTLMQIIATEVLRNEDPDFHVNKTLASLDNTKNYVIDDTRFENEFNILQSYRTNFYYISRPSNWKISNHSSESTIIPFKSKYSADMINLLNTKDPDFIIYQFKNNNTAISSSFKNFSKKAYYFNKVYWYKPQLLFYYLGLFNKFHFVQSEIDYHNDKISYFFDGTHFALQSSKKYVREQMLLLQNYLFNNFNYGCIVHDTNDFPMLEMYSTPDSELDITLFIELLKLSNLAAYPQYKDLNWDSYSDVVSNVSVSSLTNEIDKKELTHFYLLGLGG
jgi:hypothetical protein